MHRISERSFVGREDEVQQIIAFHQTAITADSSSILWVEGEAGIGKTHLLKHVVQNIHSPTTVLCHIRLYPDTPATISELLDHNLSTATHLQALLKQHRASSTAAKIRHLARLRPTTLILEDIHLLADSESRKLFSLFQALAEEPVCIICVSRIGEHPAALRLLPYICQRIELAPLQKKHIKELLESFPELAASEHVVNTLHTATNGIPLVLRSVLAAIPAHTTEGSPIGIESILTQLIEHNAKASVQSLTAGLTSGLTTEEYRHACMLASLGEVFSEEAAQLITDTPASILETLSQKGIITQVREAVLPILGAASHTLPWRFAHTILRNELAAHLLVPVETLLNIVDHNLPLYSTTLLHDLANRQIQDSKLLLRIHRYLRALLKKHELEYHFALLSELSTIVLTFVETNFTLLSDLEEVNAELEVVGLTHFQESLHRVDSERIKASTLDYLKKTENPQTFVDAEHRLLALASALYLQTRISDIETLLTPLSCLEEVNILLAQFPQLIRSTDFMRFLTGIAATTRAALNSEVIRQLRQHLNAVLDIEREESVIEPAHLHSLVGVMLTLFITKEEAQDCIHLAERTLATHKLHELPEQFAICYIPLLTHTNQMHKAQDVLNSLQSNSAIQSTHSPFTRFLYAIESLLIDIAFGAPRLYVEHHLNKCVRWAYNADPEFAHSYCERIALGVVLSAAHFYRDKSWLESTIENYASNPAVQKDIEQVRHSYALFTGNIHELRSDNSLKFGDMRFHGLIECGRSETLDVNRVHQEALQFFEGNSFNCSYLLAIGSATTFVENIFNKFGQPITDTMQALIANGLRHALQIWKDNDLVGPMRSFLHQSKKYFSDDEYALWNAALNKAESLVALKFQWHSNADEIKINAPLQLSMLGQISVSHAGDQPKPVQGAKARAILGLMVANQLARQPLSYKGFREVIFGNAHLNNGSTDNIRAAIARIRKILGKDSIITDGKTPPTINLDLVDVDLVRVANTLNQCNQAVRAHYPRKAKQHILEVLNSGLDGPAYPTLYDPFFESARLDFELQVRNTVLAVAGILRSEGDVEGAIAVVQSGIEQMPGDEELLTLLSEMLAIAGRNIEAISVLNAWV